MNLHPVLCNQQTFQSVCKDLLLWGEVGHEMLFFQHHQNGHLPTTRKRSTFFSRVFKRGHDSNHFRQEMKGFLCAFFEKNAIFLSVLELDLLTKCSKKSRRFQDRYLVLIKTIGTNTDQKIVKQQQAFLNFGKVQKKALYLKTGIEAQRIMTAAKKLAENLLLTYEQECREKIEERHIESQKLLKQEHETLSLLSKKLKEVENKAFENFDTILFSKDEKEIFTHSKFLKRIELFKQAESFHEEKESGFFRYQLPASSGTIYQFLSYLENPNSLEEIKDIDDLLNLYSLADFFQWNFLKNVCLELIEPKITTQTLFELFIYSNLPPSDLLLQSIADHFYKSFSEYAKHPLFLKISHEYLIEILKKFPKHPIKEPNITSSVLEWAFEKENPREILNKKLVDDSLSDLLDLSPFHLLDYLFQNPHSNTSPKEVLLKRAIIAQEELRWRLQYHQQVTKNLIKEKNSLWIQWSKLQNQES